LFWDCKDKGLFGFDK